MRYGLDYPMTMLYRSTYCWSYRSMMLRVAERERLSNWPKNNSTLSIPLANVLQQYPAKYQCPEISWIIIWPWCLTWNSAAVLPTHQISENSAAISRWFDIFLDLVLERISPRGIKVRVFFIVHRYWNVWYRTNILRCCGVTVDVILSQLYDEPVMSLGNSGYDIKYTSWNIHTASVLLLVKLTHNATFKVPPL